ncbi:hypothetical protein IJS77_02715 [bacterium]|nr:hypothetical protein [bacterium]
MIGSIPCNPATYAVKKVAFKGDALTEIETASPKTETTSEKTETAKINPESIRNSADKIANSVDAVTDGIDRTTNSVTNAVTKTTGAFTLICGAFSKLIPTPVKDFFATPQFTKNEAGEMIPLMKKGSDGIERAVRKFNMKNTAIALGITAALITAYTIYKNIKNKAKPKEKIEA